MLALLTPSSARAQIDEYMGLGSRFANCSCIENMLHKVMEHSVPKFARCVVLCPHIMRAAHANARVHSPL